MTERMHPEDLRAMVAAHIYGQGLQLIQGVQWQNVNDFAQTVHDADALLVVLARTAKPEPQCDGCDIHKERDAANTRAEYAEAGMRELAARATALDQEKCEMARQLAYSDAHCNDLARRTAQMRTTLGTEMAGWDEMADTARRMRERLAAIDAAKAGEPPMPQHSVNGQARNDLQEALEAWGRQGWDAAAALRVDLAGALAQLNEANRQRDEARRGKGTD